MPTVSMRRVVITGMGAISPLGVGAEALWQGLREGRSAIGPLRHPDAERLRVKIAAQVPASFDPAANIDERTLPMLDRTSEFALHAAREAITQSGLDLRQDGLGVRTAVVVGTGGNNGWAAFCRALDLQHLEHDPRFATNRDRVANAEELRVAVEDVMRWRPTSHWMARMAAEGVRHMLAV